MYAIPPLQGLGSVLPGQIMAAINYNRRQTSWNVGGAGAYMDRGDPRLAADALQFQVLAKAEGAELDPDGKIGPQTIDVLQNAINFGWPASRPAQALAQKIALNTTGIASVPTAPAQQAPAARAPAPRAPASRQPSRRAAPTRRRAASKPWKPPVRRKITDREHKASARRANIRRQPHWYAAMEAAKRRPGTPAYAAEQQRIALEIQRAHDAAKRKRNYKIAGGIGLLGAAFWWWKSRRAAT